MAALPYMQLYVAEYLADTLHLNAAQHGAYMLLLMNYWQRGKSLPNSDARLAVTARLSIEDWEINKGALAEFFTVTDTEWIHSRVEKDLETVRVKCSQASNAGKASAQRRRNETPTEKQRPFNDRSTTVEIPLNGNATIKNRTEQNIQKEQKPSRVSATSDPRHIPFRLAVETYAKHKGVLFAWDGGAAKQLDLLLKSTPDLTLLMFQTCLNHRARSPGTPHGEHPKAWLPHVLKYQTGPLDQFGKTGEASGNHSKTGASVNAAQQAIGLIRARQDGADRADAGEAGYSPASEAGRERLLGPG